MEHVAAGAAEPNWVRFCGADDTSSSRGKGGANRLHSNLRRSCTSDCEIRCDGVMMTVGARGSVASMGVFLPSAPKWRVAPAVFISCTDSCQLCISLLFKRQAWRVQHLCLLSLLFASGASKVLEVHFKAHGLIKSSWNALWFSASQQMSRLWEVQPVAVLPVSKLTAVSPTLKINFSHLLLIRFPTGSAVEPVPERVSFCLLSLSNVTFFCGPLLVGPHLDRISNSHPLGKKKNNLTPSLSFFFFFFALLTPPLCCPVNHSPPLLQTNDWCFWQS